MSKRGVAGVPKSPSFGVGFEGGLTDSWKQRKSVEFTNPNRMEKKMDEADRADRVTEVLIESGRMMNHKALLQIAASNGHCLNCDERLDDGRRWCDEDCRDDWVLRNRG